MLTYSLDHVPFSLAGSFLTITSINNTGTHRLLYKTSARRIVNEKHLPFNSSDFFEIAVLREGTEVPYTYTAKPHRLDLHAEGGGKVTFVFSDADTLIFKAKDVRVRLEPRKSFASGYKLPNGGFCLVDWTGCGNHHFHTGGPAGLGVNLDETLSGVLYEFKDKAWTVDFLDAEGSIHFSPYESLGKPNHPDFDSCLDRRKKDYAQWSRDIPSVPEKYRSAAESAWYILWNCQVPKIGRLTRPAIYMSKFWMNAIWAWDNCFNALAVAHADPELAWDQLLLFFDHQDPNGMIPDVVCDLDAFFNFTKPPIQGWTIRKLVETTGKTDALPYLKKLYKPLKRYTEWWYTMRDFDNDGMCQYHHGNDSGWDNATLFDQGYPTEGSDLAAYLVLQCEALSFIANMLGKKAASYRWKKKAAWQVEMLLKQAVKEGHFVSPLNGEREAAECHSLLNYMPILLGKRLPKALRKSLATDLSPDGPFLTPYGLATESPLSVQYQSDGYWRGPIWAPSTFLMYDGLKAAGEEELARTIAERFCDMCLESPGFWENYDALTGQGLRCPGYSWTASVFLLLAADLKD